MLDRYYVESVRGGDQDQFFEGYYVMDREEDSYLLVPFFSGREPIEHAAKLKECEATATRMVTVLNQRDES